MIEIKIIKKGKLPNKLYATGHANYSEKGKDIVCSAFSFLIQSISMYLLNSDIDIEKRDEELIILDLNKLYYFDRKLYDYLMFSLKILENKYHKYIKIIEIEE